MEPVNSLNIAKLESISIICPKCINANVINIHRGKLPDVEWFRCSFCEANSPKSGWLVSLDRIQSIQQERDKQQQERDYKHQLFLMKSEECQNKLVTIETMKSRAIRAEQQVNTLTEALKWYEKQDIICTPRYCDGGQRAREALQSIKESPREEQTK